MNTLIPDITGTYLRHEFDYRNGGVLSQTVATVTKEQNKKGDERIRIHLRHVWFNDHTSVNESNPQIVQPGANDKVTEITLTGKITHYFAPENAIEVTFRRTKESRTFPSINFNKNKLYFFKTYRHFSPGISYATKYWEYIETEKYKKELTEDEIIEFGNCALEALETMGIEIQLDWYAHTPLTWSRWESKKNNPTFRHKTHTITNKKGRGLQITYKERDNYIQKTRFQFDGIHYKLVGLTKNLFEKNESHPKLDFTLIFDEYGRFGIDGNIPIRFHTPLKKFLSLYIAHNPIT